ncbi:MAG: cytidine deaminase [Armatimonadota bacterium]|nr:cytidine deaminase [Armatimonadota bacterium]MDR7439777.1 cytidine deaminase [Armatimonadota bacterium]MDR7562262.1 cytidine deaminase [Armatimonadota bacterium]MDR7568321.1 cytidine deaminase [Armatimonadota bacterium]MDR7603019.1 cytidine deaminase [Armatimonadota bacterium]
MRRELQEHTAQQLLRAAQAARRRAYAPYSRFRVGAAVLAPDGSVYTGCNVENGSYGLSVCAERVAVQKAVSEGQRRVLAVAVAGPGARELLPCGACRQVLLEFHTRFVVTVGRGRLRIYRLEELLPQPFLRPE